MLGEEAGFVMCGFLDQSLPKGNRFLPGAVTRLSSAREALRGRPVHVKTCQSDIVERFVGKVAQFVHRAPLAEPAAGIVQELHLI
jgi:hypothetical protein